MKALVVDDEAPIRDVVAEVLRTEGWSVSEADSATRAIEMLREGEWALVFCDVKLGSDSDPDGYTVLRHFTKEQPEAQIVLMTGHGSAVGALDAVASGAYDYLMKPFAIEEVQSIARAVRNGIEKRAGPTTGDLLLHLHASDIELVGRSSAFVELMKLVGRVAGTNLPVLITGESGTGKEIVARAIHQRSTRAGHAFVAVNCGAIPSELIESELFGHVRGSFTGADRDRLGLLQEADGGTIFLDEITETTPAFQVKLLRALQAGEIRRVGSNNTINVNVRVIAATNRDVEYEMRAGRFRQDLLYRLNAVTLYLPPLRERREDIMPLAKFFAKRLAQAGERSISFSHEAIEHLENYYWPGNIRELENAIIRAAVLCDQIVRPEDLPERIRDSQAVAAEEENDGASASDGKRSEVMLPLSEIENRHVARVLAFTNGNKQAAARILGIDRTTLQRMIKRHKLELNGSEDGGHKT
ncbi:MAG TPA: sigma-54 dependent transcriptional regulator [Pyrinomonadaceae bacterium]|nr:sigma-54 dependent transcriptional regulator [Pyrinomonadaceae bacterium]